MAQLACGAEPDRAKTAGTSFASPHTVPRTAESEPYGEDTFLRIGRVRMDRRALLKAAGGGVTRSSVFTPLRDQVRDVTVSSCVE